MGELEEIKDWAEKFEKRVNKELEVPLYERRKRFSVAEFAKINKPMRIGLRHVHRAWSASVDGFIEEAKKMKELSIEEIKEAKKHLAEIEKIKKE